MYCIIDNALTNNTVFIDNTLILMFAFILLMMQNIEDFLEE